VLKEGDAAPHFRTTADDGQIVSLVDYNTRNLILYFYPKADTTGCTHEAVEFTSAMEQFDQANTAIVGCSGDSVEDQARFKAKYSLNFPLLADTDFEVIEAYGARRMKTFFGKSFLGIVRMSFWIGPDGKIRKVWEKVTPKGHAAEVLAAVRGLAQIERAV
jgi:thioredoxin-dependent peroxiredoxin